MQLRQRRTSQRARVAALLASEEADEDYDIAVDANNAHPEPLEPVPRPRLRGPPRPVPDLLKAAFKTSPQFFDLNCLLSLRLVSRSCKKLAESSPTALRGFKFWRHLAFGHPELLAFLKCTKLSRRAVSLHVHGSMEFGLGASLAKHTHLQGLLQSLVLDDVGPGAEAIVSGTFPFLSSFTIRNVHKECRILSMLKHAPWQGLKELTVIVGGPAPAADVAAALAAFPELRALTLSFVDLQGQVKSHILKDSLQKLVSLTVEDDQTIFIALSAAARLGLLRPGGPSLPCLRELDLNIGYSAFPDLAEMASAPWVPALRTLRLRNYSGVPSGAMARLLARLADGPLEHLLLGSGNSSAWDWDCESCRLPHLTGLALVPSWRLLSNVLSRVATASLPKLENLEIGRPCISQDVRLADAEGVDAVAAALPCLRRFKVTGMGLTEPVLAKIEAVMVPRLEECIIHKNGEPGAELVCLCGSGSAPQ